jgi:hypothetical protein
MILWAICADSLKRHIHKTMKKSASKTRKAVKPHEGLWKSEKYSQT